MIPRIITAKTSGVAEVDVVVSVHMSSYVKVDENLAPCSTNKAGLVCNPLFHGPCPPPQVGAIPPEEDLDSMLVATWGSAFESPLRLGAGPTAAGNSEPAAKKVRISKKTSQSGILGAALAMCLQPFTKR